MDILYSILVKNLTKEIVVTDLLVIQVSFTSVLTTEYGESKSLKFRWSCNNGCDEKKKTLPNDGDLVNLFLFQRVRHCVYILKFSYKIKIDSFSILFIQ